MICFLPAFSSKRSPNICDKVLIAVLTQHHAICFSSNRMSPLISTGCSRFLFISTDRSDRYQALNRILGRSQVLPRKLWCLGETSHAVISVQTTIFFKSKLTEVGTAITLFAVWSTQSVYNLCCNHCFVRIHPGKLSNCNSSTERVLSQMFRINHIPTLKTRNSFDTE